MKISLVPRTVRFQFVGCFERLPTPRAVQMLPSQVFRESSQLRFHAVLIIEVFLFVVVFDLLGFAILPERALLELEFLSI